MQPNSTSKRRFKSPYWDVPPVGFENVTPKEYKAMQAAGQIPHSVVNPSSQILQGTKYAHPDPMEAARAAAAIINATILKGTAKTAPALTRQARRLYVGNIPFNVTESEIIEFFQSNMISTQPGSPVLACQINLDKNFAFVEFRTVEETTNAIALDGTICKGQALKIRRPHDYQPISGSDSITAMGANVAPGVVSSIVADSPNKIYIGGLPTYMTDDQTKELLSSFGQLKAFNLIKDPSTLASKGYAFCEYVDPTRTDHAIVGLHGSDIGDKKLVVQRASVGSKSSGQPTTTKDANSTSTLATPVLIQVPGLTNILPSSTPRVLTEVLCLMNMVSADELKDDEEYEDIVEDIREECLKYGAVRSIEIPRPSKHSDDPVPGLGKVFVEFDSATEAQRAQRNLSGRRFANRLVATAYFDRDRYRNKEF